MATAEGSLAYELEAAVDDLEFRLDAAGVDFEVTDSPNANQHTIILSNGDRRAYVTAELSWDDSPTVFVDIYSVDASGRERWVCGDLEVTAAAIYIISAGTSAN